MHKMHISYIYTIQRREGRLSLLEFVVVIIEISSAQGDKNSASSAQKNSHSWHKD